MRVLTANTEPYLRALATSVCKDPASLEHWRCLHITPNAENQAESYARAIQQVKRTIPEMDGDVIHCADNDVLIISRGLPLVQLQEVGDMLIESATGMWENFGEMRIYDMFYDWHDVSELLQAKTRNVGEPKPATAITETPSALHAVFEEAKIRRQQRTPLQIMLVEDDALTRRLVAAGFKDTYALIATDNAEDAVEKYLLHAPDVVFLDIGLPGQSGFAALQKIMAYDPNAYVVMFSGNSYLDNISTAFDAGASGFIAKPFRKDKMQHYIEDGAMHHRKQCA